MERQPWYVSAKQWAATWLVEHDIMWPLLDNAPWFILTHYPEVNDSFSWLDGAGILMFVVGATICVGGAAYLSLWIADRIAPAPAVPARPPGPARPAQAGAGLDSVRRHRRVPGPVGHHGQPAQA